MKRATREWLSRLRLGPLDTRSPPNHPHALDALATEAEVKRLRAMLKRLQFSNGPGGLGKTPQGKCPVCLGWDGSPSGNGETRMRHTKDCELAALLEVRR